MVRLLTAASDGAGTLMASSSFRPPIHRLQHGLGGRPRAEADRRHAIAIAGRRASLFAGAMTDHAFDDVARPLERQEADARLHGRAAVLPIFDRARRAAVVTAQV